MYTKIVSSLKPVLGIVLAVSTLTFGQNKQNPSGGVGQKKVAGTYTDVNGIKLYYEIHGKGKPLILLHGGLGAIEMFGPNLPALAKGRKVIAVDLQGHGRTADIDRPLSHHLIADDVAALIKYLGFEQCDIMGWSFGGGIALQTAIRHPEVVDRLIVVSIPFRRDGFYPDILTQQARVNAAAAEGMKQTPMYQMYIDLAPRPEGFPQLLEKIGEFMKKDYDYSQDIAGIKAKTLVVCGDADMFPPSHAVEMFGLLGGGKKDGGWDGSGKSNAQLAILPGMTHYAIGSDPRLLAVAIRFLDETASGGNN